MSWQQVYDPLGNGILSALVASIPIIVLLGTLAFLRLKAHRAAILGLAAAFVIAVAVFGMPVEKAGAVTIFGAAYGRDAADVAVYHQFGPPAIYSSMQVRVDMLAGPPG